MELTNKGSHAVGSRNQIWRGLGVVVTKTHSNPGLWSYVNLIFWLEELLESEFLSIKWEAMAPQWVV